MKLSMQVTIMQMWMLSQNLPIVNQRHSRTSEKAPLWKVELIIWTFGRETPDNRGSDNGKYEC